MQVRPLQPCPVFGVAERAHQQPGRRAALRAPRLLLHLVAAGRHPAGVPARRLNCMDEVFGKRNVQKVLAQATTCASATTGSGDCNTIQTPNPAAFAVLNYYACGQRGLPYVWGG